MSGEGTTQVSTVSETFLRILAAELNHNDGITADLVPRDGRRVLFVVSSSPRLCRVEVGCYYTLEEGWWYEWVADPSTIAPIQDPAGAADVIVKHLRTGLGLPPCSA